MASALKNHLCHPDSSAKKTKGSARVIKQGEIKKRQQVNPLSVIKLRIKTELGGLVN